LKILFALTYYRPHISGLTVYVERLVRALAERGHEVTVLTSHYEHGLPREEVLGGARIVRVPVAFRLSKGVIMPTFGFEATRLVRENEVLSVHLPQFDAWGLALRGRLFRKPCILTYHCDLRLPPGAFNRFVDQVTFVANFFAALWADRIVTNTRDFADHSRLLRRFSSKIEPVLPPVEMPPPVPARVEAFRDAHGLRGRPVIGFAARFAAEKGIEVFIEAVPELQKRLPGFKVLFVGPYQDVVGEHAYRDRLFPKVAALGEQWQFLGMLPAEDMPSFFASLDCLLVPSLNMTESFGLVQVEAMLCGTPVVASSLPGVRQPVRMTGMGEITPIGDAAALAAAVERVVKAKERYVRPRAEIEALFSIENTVAAYERLFEEQLRARKAAQPAGAGAAD
jgi:glycosyltransferase involved in cell wall biosynthesis